ncbi:MAG: phosphate ABC transporter permease PstA [Deltaproteobacteria bacterium]|nr:phosphate ABC transporter permease PstA [Deltaproteobacteria bacterium]MDQ3296205.1 phosphate ABC transporter permease PstA [Myxococcota bacterium]
MTTVASDLHAKPSWRSARSAIMTGLMVAAVGAVALPLVAVLWAVIERGASVAFASFPDFFTSEIPVISRRAGPGMGPAIVGTFLVTGGATLLSVPLGILGAIYLNEYGGTRKLARAVRFMATVMTGVPSIVMGLFIYIMWTMRFGYSAFGGALALAALMLPVVIGSTEQMLRLVPSHLREASYALGATKSRTIIAIVLPAAAPGIVSGCLLAVARAAGETAPLLFAVGAATAYNPSLFDEANTSLSLQIFGNATSSFAAAQDRAWGAAFTLVLLTFLVTFIARVVTARFSRMR